MMNLINIKKRSSDDVNYNLYILMTNSSHFLLTILLKNYCNSISQQARSTTIIWIIA